MAVASVKAANADRMVAKRDDEIKSVTGLRSAHTLVYRIFEARELPKVRVS